MQKTIRSLLKLRVETVRLGSCLKPGDATLYIHVQSSLLRYGPGIIGCLQFQSCAFLAVTLTVYVGWYRGVRSPVVILHYSAHTSEV